MVTSVVGCEMCEMRLLLRKTIEVSDLCVVNSMYYVSGERAGRGY